MMSRFPYFVAENWIVPRQSISSVIKNNKIYKNILKLYFFKDVIPSLKLRT